MSLWRLRVVQVLKSTSASNYTWILSPWQSHLWHSHQSPACPLPESSSSRSRFTDLGEKWNFEHKGPHCKHTAAFQLAHNWAVSATSSFSRCFFSSSKWKMSSLSPQLDSAAIRRSLVGFRSRFLHFLVWVKVQVQVLPHSDLNCLYLHAVSSIVQLQKWTTRCAAVNKWNKSKWWTEVHKLQTSRIRGVVTWKYTFVLWWFKAQFEGWASCSAAIMKHARGQPHTVDQSSVLALPASLGCSCFYHFWLSSQLGRQTPYLNLEVAFKVRVQCLILASSVQFLDCSDQPLSLPLLPVNYSDLCTRNMDTLSAFFFVGLFVTQNVPSTDLTCPEQLPGI